MSLNWGLIGSGGTFESLVHTILRLEFPSTLLFGRPGPDSGQDAISGDRRTVYQAKFRTPCTMKAVKAAALEEAKSIETYRDPKHSNSDLWKSVSDWVLVANYRKNPNDQREWDADVVPAFAALKIVPHLWGIEELEALIAKHPEVTRHYFQGETRTFLGLLEAREFLASYQVNAKGMEVPLAGRDREVTDVTQRIEGRAKKLFHIYGPGGVGKTRLAYEIASSIGQKGWQILWAATRSMERSTNWFAALPASSQKTLVVVDEPEDPATLEALIEQVSVPGGAAGNWKVLVTTRTPKDPVVEVIKRSRSAQVDDSIQVQAPSRNDGMEIARALLRDAVPASELERVCGHVCRLADNYPIWINLAARLISERGSIAELPDTSAALADQYLAEVIYQWIRPSHPLPDVEEIVRWLALFGAINIEDKEQVSFIASHIQSKSASAVAQIVEKLEERSLVQSRGARRRWREIKPDVLKDHVVYKLLLNAQGANAAEVTKLSTTMLGGWKGGPVPQLEDLLRVLSRIELMKKASGTPIDLLGAFYKAVKSEISSGTTAVQLSLALLLEKATLGRTTDIIECVDLFLKNKKPPETTKVEIWGERTVSHVDVVK